MLLTSSIIKKIKFLFIGGTTAMLNFSVVALVKEFFKGGNNLAVTSGYIVGLIYHFSMNKFFVFKEENLKKMLNQVPQYLVLSLINYLITMAITNFLYLFKTNVYVSLAVATLITMILTYTVMNRLIFAIKKT